MVPPSTEAPKVDSWVLSNSDILSTVASMIWTWFWLWNWSAWKPAVVLCCWQEKEKVRRKSDLRLSGSSGSPWCVLCLPTSPAARLFLVCLKHCALQHVEFSIKLFQTWYLCLCCLLCVERSVYCRLCGLLALGLVGLPIPHGNCS